jgi:molybdopterin synthase sulfur carrier subunit
VIQVLLFAHLKDQAGSEKVTIEEERLTVKELIQILQEKYSLTNIEQVMIAINEEYSVDEDIVKSGDIVALIPPVSGG